jgi:hypothetical protein
MVEARPKKGHRIGMAHFAGAVGHNMLGMLAGGHHAPSLCMAASTGGRCALENTTGVAGFTFHIDVHPGQRKAGGGVIEFAPRTLLILRMRRSGEYQQSDKQQGLHKKI